MGWSKIEANIVRN